MESLIEALEIVWFGLQLLGWGVMFLIAFGVISSLAAKSKEAEEEAGRKKFFRDYNRKNW